MKTDISYALKDVPVNQKIQISLFVKYFLKFKPKTMGFWFQQTGLPTKDETLMKYNLTLINFMIWPRKKQFSYYRESKL